MEEKKKQEEPKIIAFYLPQFHNVPENDEWWGKGFTDWVSTKNAESLFRKHNQPRIPLHGKYYNLLKRETMEWQAKLAKKAGIYGFCIYHYWFGEKQLLEKPAENLLEWKEIDISYCFSWANESWVRSWSRYDGNAWVSTDLTAGNMQNRVDKGNSMLIRQSYGGEEEWKKHFMYLLPFFRDKRYIKKDNKPVFVIYLPEQMKCIKRMIRYWNRLALENGFNGVFFIGTNCEDWKKYELDAMLRYEPKYTTKSGRFSKSYSHAKRIRSILGKVNVTYPWVHSYAKVWRHILKREISESIFPGGFVDFDSTPRNGKNAEIYFGASPERFYRFFSKLYRKCKENGVEYIFMTAWNEWGEGAYLEPDEKFGAGYLKVIRRIRKINLLV